MYREQYYAQYGGKVGVALNTGHTWPRDPNNPEDVSAADRAYQFYVCAIITMIYAVRNDKIFDLAVRMVCSCLIY